MRTRTSPPPEQLEVEVTAGEPWSVEPGVVATDNTPIVIRGVNNGSEAIRPVVVDTFGGYPHSLPLQDGYVYIRPSGVIDSQSDHASLGVAYAEGVDIVEGEFIGKHAKPSPGESTEVVSRSGNGAIVVFDYRQGELETGAFVVTTRTGEVDGS